MKRSIINSIILLFPLVYFFQMGYTQEKANPVISDFGGIYDIPDSYKPDPNLEYKLLIDLKTSGNPEEINKGLNNVARLINLHSIGGISIENQKIVVAIHGNATALVLDNTSYQDRFGRTNPNSELVKQLKEAGVGLFVCGQSLKGRGFSAEEVNENVNIGLSMLTVASEHLMKGYEMFVFD